MKKKLMLHSCCGPCLTAVSEKLNGNFELAIFWYNPNIEPKSEHSKRLKTLRDFCRETGLNLAQFDYDYEAENLKWHKFIAGFENEPEGGQRCRKCIEFRLKKLAGELADLEYDTAATTLSVSPHKNARLINETGQKFLGARFLAGDFKKENGFKRSVELSKKYNLYRQDYCGCEYSLEKKRNE